MEHEHHLRSWMLSRKLPWNIWNLPWNQNPGSFLGSFREIFRGRRFHESFDGSFHGSSGRAMEVTSTEACTIVSTSTEAVTEALPRKLPRVRKLPRKHFHGFLFYFRGGKWHLPQKVGSSADSTKASTKAFEVASTKSWKLRPLIFTFYFLRSFPSFHGISAASTTAPTDIFVLYTAVPD